MGGGTGGRMRSGGRHWETDCFAGPCVQSHRCPSRATMVAAYHCHHIGSSCSCHHPREAVQCQLSTSHQIHSPEASYLP